MNDYIIISSWLLCINQLLSMFDLMFNKDGPHHENPGFCSTEIVKDLIRLHQGSYRQV